MKATSTLILLASLVSGQSKDGSAPASSACVTKLSCKMTEVMTNPDTMKKTQECSNSKDMNEIPKCIYKAIGFKPNQVDTLAKLVASFEKCTPTPDSETTGCISKCSGDTGCAEKCAEPLQSKFGACITKLAGKPNFDIKKSKECSSKCNQDSLPDVFDCDYKCNKDVYDSLVGKSGSGSENGDKSNSTDTKSGGSDKDPKSGDKSPSGGSSGSNAVLGFESKSIAAIALPILFSLFLF